MERMGLTPRRRLRQPHIDELVSVAAREGVELATADYEAIQQGERKITSASRVRLRRRAHGSRSASVSAAHRSAMPNQGPPAGPSTLSCVGIHSFKSFASTTLPLSALTLLIGANASGKSNALEALQLLSWMAKSNRLYELPSALRDRQLGLRGRAADLAFDRNTSVPIRLECALNPDEAGKELNHWIELAIDGDSLRVVGEELSCPQEPGDVPLYQVVERAPPHGREMTVAYNNFARGKNKPRISCVDEQPVFLQLLTPARFGATHEKSQRVIPEAARRIEAALSGILFLDPSPRAMRGYSFLSQKRLDGDGGNLSAILHDLTETRGERDAVLNFVSDLPEQHIRGLGYLQGPRGEVMVKLEESFGSDHRWCEAALLSDGTLRVLAIAAALLSVPEGSLVVIEEIDNGVHPWRAHQLLHRIQSVSQRRKLRILLTTHNPALLDVLPKEALPDVVATYRDPKEGDSRLQRLSDLEAYPELLAAGKLGQLATKGILDHYLKRREGQDERRDQGLAWFRQSFGGEE